MSTAVGTETVNHVIDRNGTETFGKFHGRDVCLAETKRTMAALAIEMDVLVVEGALSFSPTNLVFLGTASVLDAVYKVVLKE